MVLRKKKKSQKGRVQTNLLKGRKKTEKNHLQNVREEVKIDETCCNI